MGSRIDGGHDKAHRSARTALACWLPMGTLLAAALGSEPFVPDWTARIAVDFLYYEHRDRPKGAQFVAGHIPLTGLFLALAATYWAVLIPGRLR